MPNYKVHMPVGALAGAGLAYIQSSHREDLERRLAAVGGAIGGLLTSRLPDAFDPPTGPNHRGAGHSIMIGGLTIGIYLWQFAPKAMKNCYEQAESAKETGNWLDMIKWLIAAGIVWGLAAGYGSHLLLDHGTQKSLPM